MVESIVNGRLCEYQLAMSTFHCRILHNQFLIAQVGSGKCLNILKQAKNRAKT